MTGGPDPGATDPAHHDALLTLTNWLPPGLAQAHLKAEFIAHLRAHPDAVRRTCRPSHLTASLLVVNPEVTQILLHLHRRSGRWLQFGGHIEANDPTLVAAALREGREESGLLGIAVHPGGPLTLDNHAVTCRTNGPSRHLDVQFLAVDAGHDVPAVSAESVDVRWWNTDEAPVDDSVRAMIEQARLRLGVAD